MRVKDQDSLEKKSNVVYQVPCSCGHVYIGETKRALQTRIKEHKVATRRGELEKSAITEHAWKHHHKVEWDEIKVLDEAANTTMPTANKRSPPHPPHRHRDSDKQR